MRIAYVLSGGGAKGAVQAGVMKQLDEKGIKPDVIYGTSVGAINAAMYAYGGIKKIEQSWLGMVGPKWYSPWTPSSDILAFNWSNLIGIFLSLGINTVLLILALSGVIHSDVNFLALFFTLPLSGFITFLAFGNGIYNTSPLRKSLGNVCGGLASCEAIVVKCSLDSGEVSYVSNQFVSNNDFLDSVQGSGIIPGIMSPVGEWVDGGTRQQVALEKAIADSKAAVIQGKPGFDRIYVILCNPLVENPTDLYDTNKVFSVLKFLSLAYRSIDGVMEHEVFWANCRSCITNTSGIPITLYAPSVVPCSTLQFDPKIVPGIIEMGYTATPLEIPPI